MIDRAAGTARHQAFRAPRGYHRVQNRPVWSDATMESTKRGVFRTGSGWCACAWSSRGLSALVLPVLSRRGALAALARIRPGTSSVTRPVPACFLRAVRAALRGRPFRAPRYDLSDRPVFTRRVLKVTARIPRGRVATYGQVAARAGKPGASRAVGQVMNRNPIPLLIPCHRVVAAGRKLGGYGGGLALKIKLLKNEGIPVNNSRKSLYRPPPL